MKGPRRNPGRQTRAVAAIGLAAGMAVLFTSLGGAGLAQNAVSAAQGQYGKKVTLCHKGKKTISVGKAAVPAHLRHGDTLGTCASAAAKAKKAKLKAAKIKAAKAKAARAKAAKARAEKRKSEKAKAERSAPETAKGKPEDRGKPDDRGKPEHKGKPDDKGKPDTPHPGKGERK